MFFFFNTKAIQSRHRNKKPTFIEAIEFNSSFLIDFVLFWTLFYHKNRYSGMAIEHLSIHIQPIRGKIQNTGPKDMAN